MNSDTWTRVDHYLGDLLGTTDSALDAALSGSAIAGLPAINVAPNQGKLLMLLTRMHRARSVLEVGTLGGYSTIWLARGLAEGGRLVTVEADPTHAHVARDNIARAGFADMVDVRLGQANETLAALVEEGSAPFDVVFLDADKEGYPDYLRWSLELTAPGSVLIADNVVRQGAVADSSTADSRVAGIRRFLEMVAAEPRLDATVIQTVGSKGYDGFLLATVV